MADELKPPVLIKSIPPQIINEGAAFGPFKLNEYIQSPDEASGDVRFLAELESGAPLPKGMICTSDGIVTGIPAAGTEGVYKVIVVAENDASEHLTTEFTFTIKARISLETSEAAEFYGNLKSRVWEALGNDLPLPDIGELLDRPITPIEIYHLLQLFGTLTIWDVYNLEPPGSKVLLQVEGANEHYNIYDRGSCLVASPKDLFSHERTLEDALQSSRALAGEAYKRGWVIEFAGFDKMVRAAWIEIQHLGDVHGKPLEILHFTPSVDDVKLYNIQAQSGMRSGR